MALLQLRDYSDEATGPGFVPVPAKAAKRARTKLLPGSCAVIEPLPGNPGESRRGPSELQQHDGFHKLCAAQSVNSQAADLMGA